MSYRLETFYNMSELTLKATISKSAVSTTACMWLMYVKLNPAMPGNSRGTLPDCVAVCVDLCFSAQACIHSRVTEE